MRFPNRSLAPIFLAVQIASFTVSGFAADPYPKPPLNKREVVALVAGAALPESIAADVKAHGLNFHASPQYIARLREVGVDPLVIDALKKASVTASKSGSHPDDNVVLEHLFTAVEKLRAKQLMDAAIE